MRLPPGPQPAIPTASRAERQGTEPDRRLGRLSPVNDAAVLVPVKAFDQAKIRLAPVLSPAERIELARRMATHVVRVAAPLPVTVVCDDPEVADWAAALGATVVWCPETGLNGAVTRGVAELALRGVAEVVVAHSDLPRASGFAHLAGAGGVTAVPDRHADGTNVLCLPTGAPFDFSYGAGSFRRHCAEARRLGLALRIVRDPELTWDVDVPDDLIPAPVPESTTGGKAPIGQTLVGEATAGTGCPP